MVGVNDITAQGSSKRALVEAMNAGNIEKVSTSSPMATSYPSSESDHSRDVVATADSSSPPSILPRLVSGSVGSIVTALAVTPLEVVKVRQQAAINNSPSAIHSELKLPSGVTVCPRGCGTFVLNNGLMDCILPKDAIPALKSRLTATAPPPALKANSRGTLSMLRHIFQSEGLQGIYAGLRPTLVMSVPNTVLYFTAYDEIVSFLRSKWQTVEKDSQYNDMAVPLVGGSSSRLLASFTTAPLELIRTRQASLVGSGIASKAPGIAEEFRVLVQSKGFAYLYSGLAPTLWRDVPFSAIYWLCLERFKDVLLKSEGMLGGRVYVENGTQIPPLLGASHAFLSGAAAGMIAASCTTPFDVVKTRQQMVRRAAEEAAVVCDHGGAVVFEQHSTNSNPGVSQTIKAKMGTFGHMDNIVRSEGISGLWRGNQTRMLKVAPACAIMISCYEFGKRVFSPPPR